MAQQGGSRKGVAAFVEATRKRERQLEQMASLETEVAKEKANALTAILQQAAAKTTAKAALDRQKYTTLLSLFSLGRVGLDYVASLEDLVRAFQNMQQRLILHYQTVKVQRLVVADTYYSQDATAQELCLDPEQSFDLVRFHITCADEKWPLVVRCVWGFGDLHIDTLLDNVLLPYKDYVRTFPDSASHNRDSDGSFQLWEDDQERVLSLRRANFVNPVALLCDEQRRPLTDLRGLYTFLKKAPVEDNDGVLFKFFCHLARDFIIQSISAAKEMLPAELRGHRFVDPSLFHACWQSAPIFDFWTNYQKRPRFSDEEEEEE
jgi:hypothetical protein